MQHEGVAFTLELVEPGLWAYRFQISGKFKAGRTRTNLQLLAERRVRHLIDRALRAAAAKPEDSPG